MKLSAMAKTVCSAVIAFGLVSNAQAADETFQATLKLLTPISITEVQALDFGEAISGTNQTLTVGAADGSAAVFSAQGDSSKTATASVVETSITMTTGDGVGTTKQIVVDNFTLGGNGITGADQVDFIAGSGNVSDIRVGGTANVEADDIAGDYAGTATFRVIYN